MFGIRNTEWLSSRFFIITLVVIVTACSEGQNEKELMDRAKGYLEAHDLNAATLELKNILREDANNAEARYLLGRISLDLGDVKTAQKELRRARDAGWDEAEVQLALAEVMLRQGYFQKVLDDIAVKDSYPDAVKADLIGLWALSEAGLGKWDEAEQTIKTGESIAKDSLWLLHSKVRLEIHNKALQTAGQILEHALKVHPDSQDLWLISAGLAEENDETMKAIEALQKVIDLDPPKNITFWGRQARLTQSQIWLKQQDFVKAKAVIEPVLKTYPGDPVSNYLGGLAAFKLGEYDLTEERLLSALKVAPEHRPSLLLSGALDYVRGDYQKAAYNLEKAAAMQPDDVGAQTLLGRTYLMLGQYDEAENRLKFASSQIGDDAELLALLGVARMRGGSDAGIQELEKAAAVSPGDTSIRSELARAYMATGETDRAIKELESALEGNDQQDKVSALLVTAYIKADELDKGLDLAMKLSEQMPNNPLPHNLAGVVYEAKQDYAAAQKSYDTALDIQPDDSVAKLGLARLDLRAENDDMALKRYQSVLETDPNNADAMLAVAVLIAQKGRGEEAIELLEKARKSDENATDPRLILSRYYLNKGMNQKALDYADEALKIAPLDSSVILAVGRIQIGAGKREAVATLRTLVERLPESADVHYYYAEAQARFGDLVGTRQSLQKTLTLKPDHVPALRALGKLDLGEGRVDDALNISEKLIMLLPEAAVGYMLKGDVALTKGKTDEALQAYRSALTHANDGQAAITISKVERSVGDFAASYDTLNKWLAQHPEDHAVRYVLALSYLADGKKDSAVSEYERILKDVPDNAAVLNDLAWLYFQRGEQGALEMAEKAYRLAPDNPAIQDTYGWILVQNGRVESGLMALEQAASRAPNIPDIRYHLAVALAKAGEKTRAKEELSSILQSDTPFSERASAEALQKELSSSSQ